MMMKDPNGNQSPGIEDDALVNEVRAIRRNIASQFDNNIDRLCDHLNEVAQDYALRRGVFSSLSKDALVRLTESWGDEARQNDSPIIDEIRAIRRNQ